MKVDPRCRAAGPQHCAIDGKYACLPDLLIEVNAEGLGIPRGSWGDHDGLPRRLSAGAAWRDWAESRCGSDGREGVGREMGPPRPVWGVSTIEKCTSIRPIPYGALPETPRHRRWDENEKNDAGPRVRVGSWQVIRCQKGDPGCAKHGLSGCAKRRIVRGVLPARQISIPITALVGSTSTTLPIEFGISCFAHRSCQYFRPGGLGIPDLSVQFSTARTTGPLDPRPGRARRGLFPGPCGR